MRGDNQSGLDISWSCNAKVTYLTEDLLTPMKRSGCWFAGRRRVRQPADINTMKKGITRAGPGRCESAYRLGFHIKTFFIIGNAGETVQTLDDTIRFMVSLPAHYSSINLMTPLPGTELWDTVEKYGSFDKERLRNKLSVGQADIHPSRA